MTLRNAAQQVLAEAREGIAWIILYKEGRGWNAESFWPDYNEKAGTLSFDSDDLPRIHEILTADPSAVIVNGYESNLGDTESMSRDTLASFLRWQYEGQYSRLSDRIQPTTDRHLEQVEQANSLDELDTITETAANDESIHAAAIRKVQEWDPQNKQEEPTARPMYKDIPEAIAIFDSLDPASVYTITEHTTGDTMTGTPAELLERILEQDRERNGAIDHSAETVEGWSIIETAYAIAGNEAVTNQDGTHKWVGLHGRK